MATIAQEREYQLIKEQILLQLRDHFALHGKSFDITKSVNVWEKPLALQSLFCKRSRSMAETKETCHLELGVEYWGKTVNSLGDLQTFRNVYHKVRLDKPMEQINRDIAKFMGKFPKWLEGIRKAEAIDEQIQEARQRASGLKQMRLNKLREITGFKLAYDSDIPTAKVAYRRLTVTGSNDDNVTVVLDIPLEKFAAFHEVIMTFLGT